MQKQAPPSTAFYDFLGWLDVNKQRVAIGAAVVALIALVVALVVWRQGQREIEAAQQLSAIRHPFNPAEPAAAGIANAFAKVAEEYPKTRAGGQALLRAGSAYFAEQQFPKAQDSFERFLRSHSETPWVSEAQFGVAASLDAQGKTAEAIARYNDFIRAYPNDPAADHARLNLARLYEATQQPRQAVDVLSKMTNAPAFSPVTAEVQERLRELYKKHPDLAPTPPVRPMPQAPPQILPQVIPNAPGPNAAPPTDAAPAAPPASTTPQPPLILPTPQPNPGQ